MNTHMHTYMYVCVCVCVYIYIYIYTHTQCPSAYISVMGVEGPTLGVSRLYAHAHMKRFGMLWNWFILASDSQWYVSPPSSVFSDVK